MTLEIIRGELFRRFKDGRIVPITASRTNYLGRYRLVEEVMWHLAFGSWPTKHVEFEEGLPRVVTSLREVTIPRKFMGRFKKL